MPVFLPESSSPPKDADKIEYIIANCAECEPYITADYRRMLEYTEDLVSGMRVILSLFPNARGIFAVEDNKKGLYPEVTGCSF